MKEKTRKTVAIGLLWVYFGLLVLTAILRNICFLEMLREGYSIAYLELLFGLIPLLIQVGVLLGSILMLRKLLNKVTRCFFNRLVTGFVILLLLPSISLVSFISRMGYIYLISYGILLFAIIIIMSGAGIISRNYSLNAYTSSKLRLFQTGVLLSFGISCIAYFIDWVMVLFGGIQIPFLLMSMIDWIGIVCIAWGLIGIIKSDLVSEGRKEDVFDKTGGGWLSRPVIGAVCFLALLSCFVFLFPDICNLLDIALWQ